MTIHTHILKALNENIGFNPNSLNDISKALDDEEGGSKTILARLHLKSIETGIKQLQSIHFEFDLNDRIDLPDQLQRMFVASRELAEYIGREEGVDPENTYETARATIFLNALVSETHDLLSWAKEYSQP